jgi:hypothetical protein
MMRRDLVKEYGHLDDPVAARQAGTVGFIGRANTGMSRAGIMTPVTHSSLQA